MYVILPVHVDVAGALDPEHAVHPRAHRHADQQVGLKRDLFSLMCRKSRRRCTVFYLKFMNIIVIFSERDLTSETSFLEDARLRLGLASL